MVANSVLLGSPQAEVMKATDAAPLSAISIQRHPVPESSTAIMANSY